MGRDAGYAGMKFPRFIPFVALTLTLGAQDVWAVEGDIVFERKDRPAAEESPETGNKPAGDVIPGGRESYPPATFPHWTHIIRYRCFVCHPRIYPMEAGATPLFGTENHKQKSCGRCHNGRSAFDASFTACSRCHISREEE